VIKQVENWYYTTRNIVIYMGSMLIRWEDQKLIQNSEAERPCKVAMKDAE